MALLPTITSYRQISPNNMGKIIVWDDNGQGKLKGICIIINENEIYFTINSRIRTMKIAEINLNMFNVDELPLKGLTSVRKLNKNSTERVTVILTSEEL